MTTSTQKRSNRSTLSSAAGPAQLPSQHVRKGKAKGHHGKKRPTPRTDGPTDKSITHAAG